MKKLGPVQRDVLQALKDHGSWSPGILSGWLWDTPGNTKRIMDSLVRAGFARVETVQIERSMRHVGGSRRYYEECIVYKPIRKKAP